MRANSIDRQARVPEDLRAGEAARDHVVTGETPMLRVHMVAIFAIAESTLLVNLRVS